MYVSHVRDNKELFLLPFQKSFRLTLDLENSEEISEGIFVQLLYDERQSFKSH